MKAASVNCAPLRCSSINCASTCEIMNIYFVCYSLLSAMYNKAVIVWQEIHPNEELTQQQQMNTWISDLEWLADAVYIHDRCSFYGSTKNKMNILVLMLLTVFSAPVTQPPRPTCQYYEFQCDDGTCIDDRLKCNQQYDCPDRTDEYDCGKCSI